MQVVDITDTDIALRADGQPYVDLNGDAAVLTGIECWLQDIKNEAYTNQNELFYETETDSYGFGLNDFAQAEYDNFTEVEIRQRISDKLSKRTDIDAASVQIDIAHDEHRIEIKVYFKLNDKEEDYNLELTVDEIEVVVV